MISIEAYRAAIGRFYGKLKRCNKKLASKDTSGANYVILFFMAVFISFAPMLLYIVITFLMCITVDLIYISIERKNVILTIIPPISVVEKKTDVIKPRRLYAIFNSSKDTFKNFIVSTCKVFKNLHDQSMLIVFIFIALNVLSFIVSLKEYNVNVKSGFKDQSYDTTCLNILYFIHHYISINLVLLGMNVVKSSRWTEMNNYSVLKTAKVLGGVEESLHDLESYNLSCLKTNQLLMDGDIESNPGPTFNVDKTPVKGRPKKIKGFRGTPKNSLDKEVARNDILNFRNVNEELLNASDLKTISCKDISKKSSKRILFLPTTLSSNARIPLGLKNKFKENVCFFNSVVQVLYSIKTFKEYIQHSSCGNIATKVITDLFLEISSSVVPVHTYPYIKKMNLIEYHHGEQYDAHECLIQILDKTYPSLTSDNLFKVEILESVLCNNAECEYVSENVVKYNTVSLDIEDCDDIQTIQGLFNTFQNVRGTTMSGSKCEKCEQKGVLSEVSKANSVTDVSNILIINLKLFKFVNGIIKKRLPALKIDLELHHFNTLELKGIIYHDGSYANSGHYTCAVRPNEQWYTMNDETVSQGALFSTLDERSIVPYILIYEKKETSTKAVNIESVVKSCTNVDNQAPEFLTIEERNKKSVLDEIQRQKDRIGNLEKKKIKEAIHVTPVKRKSKYSGNDSQKRITKFRNNLDEVAKMKVLKKDQTRKKINRENLDEVAKKRLHESEKCRIEEYRANLDEVAKK